MHEAEITVAPRGLRGALRKNQGSDERFAPPDSDWTDTQPTDAPAVEQRRAAFGVQASTPTMISMPRALDDSLPYRARGCRRVRFLRPARD